MVLDHRQHYLSPVHTVLTAVVAPIQYAVSYPIKLITDADNSLTSRQKLLAENVALRAQQLLLQGQLQKFLALENENNQLRSLLASATQMHNRRITIAQLLAVEPDTFVNEVILDKGQRDGLYLGQPVLDAYGILGQIIQIGPLTSRVLLITDLRSAIPVQDTRSGVRGLLIGNGKLSDLLLTNIPNTADVREGDILVSSGLGGRYPAGYPVGTIKTIRHNPSEQFTQIAVTPKAHPDSSQQVLLIWPPKQPTPDRAKPSH
jgi:rod shape-determining protein MreC